MNKKLISILLLMFVNVIGFSILIPVLPFIVEDYNEGTLTYGFLLSSYSLFQFIGAPILGSLSDKYGRRPILLVTQFGTLISWIIIGSAYFLPGDISYARTALPILVIALARVIDGITGGNVSVAYAYTSDITKPEDRVKVFGTIGAVFGVGLMVGPAIGGVSGSTQYGFLGTSIVAGLISLFTLVMMQLFLSESLDEENKDKEIEINVWDEINVFRKLKDFKDNPRINQLFSVRAIFAFCFSSYVSILSIYLIDKFDLNESQVGLAFFIIGIYLIINQGFLVQKVSKKFDDLKTFYIGVFFFIVGLIGIYISPNVFVFMMLVYLNNVGISFVMPTFKSLITKQVSMKKQGIITGIDESIMAGMSAIAPIIISFLYSYIGGSSYLFLAGILLCSFIWIYLLTGSFFIKVKDS